VGVINRKIDADIIAQLDTATNDTGSAATGTLALVAKSVAILGLAEVPIQEEENMFGLITPAMHAYLMQVPAFSSADYVEIKPFSGPIRRMRRWYGINWIVHPNLTGAGTNSEKCYIYHRNAIGHAMATGADLDTAVGYDDEQAYSWARASGIFGSKKLQNSGIVQVVHDGSAYVAQ
jgi:hypothetical protein